MATNQEVMEFVTVWKGQGDLSALEKKIAQLTGEIGQYMQKMSAANAAGNQPLFDKLAHDAADAVKQVKALTTQSDTLEKQLKKSGSAFKGMGSSQGLLQASYAIDDLQYGLKGVVNNIAPLVSQLGGPAGLAGALGIAAVAVNVLYNNWDKLEALFGQSKVKSEAEIVEELGKKLHKTADEVQYYYSTKKRLEDEDAKRSAFQAERKKSSPIQGLGTAQLGERASELTSLTTGISGSEHLFNILGTHGLVPPNVEQATKDKLNEANTKIKNLDKLIGQAADIVTLEGERISKESQIEQHKETKKQAEADLNDIYQKEVLPKIEAFMGRLFEHPGTETYGELNKFFSNYMNALEAKIAKDANNVKPGEITQELFQAEKAFVEKFRAAMEKTKPEDMAKLFEEEMRRKAGDMAEALDKKLKEMRELSRSSGIELTPKSQQDLDAKRAKLPNWRTVTTQSAMLDFTQQIKKIEDDIESATGVIKGLHEGEEIKKGFRTKWADFEASLKRAFKDVPGGMTEAIKKEHAIVQKMLTEALQNPGFLKADLDKFEEAIRELDKKVRRFVEDRGDMLQKAKAKINDLPGLDRNAIDEAAERLRESQKPQNAVKDKDVAAAEKELRRKKREQELNIVSRMHLQAALVDKRPMTDEQHAKLTQQYGAAAQRRDELKEEVKAAKARLEAAKEEAKHKPTPVTEAHNKAVDDMRKKLQAAAPELPFKEAQKLAKERVADAEKKAQEEQWNQAGQKFLKRQPGMMTQIENMEGRGLLQGMKPAEIERRLTDMIAKEIQKEGGGKMDPKEAQRQAAKIVGDASHALGDKLGHAAEEGMTRQQQNPMILGIKEYGAHLQTQGMDTIQMKQLTVQEQILQAILRQRPDLVQQVAGARFN